MSGFGESADQRWTRAPHGGRFKMRSTVGVVATVAAGVSAATSAKLQPVNVSIHFRSARIRRTIDALPSPSGTPSVSGPRTHCALRLWLHDSWSASYEPVRPHHHLAQLTTKIRTIGGPEATNSPSNVAFALVNDMRSGYHQQTKNLRAPCASAALHARGSSRAEPGRPDHLSGNDAPWLTTKCPSSTERSQHQVSTGATKTGDDVGFWSAPNQHGSQHTLGKLARSTQHGLGPFRHRPCPQVGPPSTDIGATRTPRPRTM